VDDRSDPRIEVEAPQPRRRTGESSLRVGPPSSATQHEREPVGQFGAGPAGIRQPDVQPAQANRSAATPASVPYPPWLDGAATTSFGGLLLVLNVFDRLGIEGWLALQPAASSNAFVTVLLAKVARRLRVPSDDPHWPLLEEAAGLRDVLGGSRWQWRGFAWPAWSLLDHVAEESMDLDGSAQRWLHALRRVLRRRCGIGLATLARRDAWLSSTSTHVDLVFALNASDLRVRRAGLDQDPGWLPWFGRIVALHFIDARSRSAPDA